MKINWSRVSGWLLMVLLGTLLLEIVGIGVFAAGWCLSCVFGKYAFAILAMIALLLVMPFGGRRRSHN